MKTTTLTLLLNILVLCISAQNGIVKIDSIYANEDDENRIVLINKDINLLNSQLPEAKKSIQFGNSHYTFSSSVLEFKYGIAYKVKNLTEKEFDLFFTQLPIINIVTNNIIIDEPRVYARLALCQSNGNFIENGIGIELRGGFTQSLPKKSYRIEFWADSKGEETKDFRLLKLRNDDDWNLQAMQNEPLRLRSKANFELWRKIDTLYYQDDEPKAINGVRMKYVELFLNNQYRGVYALSERPDRKQFKLKKNKNDEIRGELYKGISWGASTCMSLPPYSNQSELWGGFEYQYPDDEISWDNIYNFISFVIYGDNIEFHNNYRQRFNLNNAVNYFIFLNLLRATDNTGKNVFVAKYDVNEPYFYIPWDLDGTYGIIWNGTRENITNDILTNGFYKRLVKDTLFTESLSDKWNKLRQDAITAERIMNIFHSQFNYLKSNGVYQREMIAWQDSAFLDFENLKYTSVWLTKRLSYLDIVFNNPILLTKVDCVIKKQNQARIYPNPASNYLNIKPENESSIEKVQIINSLGQILYTHERNQITNNIDVSELPNGIYLVVIDLKPGMRQIEKVIINNE